MKNNIISLFFVSVGFLASLPAQAFEDPQAVVRATTERMLQALRANRPRLEQDHGLIYGLVDEIVISHFDFHRMSRYALGRFWRRASAEQKQAFRQQFQTLLVRTYALALLNYTDQQITFPPMRLPQGATEIAVATEVSSSDAPPVPIIYKMFLNDDQWKVFDVVIDGISLVSNYRRSFASQIRRRGLDGLIIRLEKRNAGGT